MKRRVIFHINEMTKWNMLVANVNNLLTAVDGGDIKIIILANGEAVKYNIVNLKIDRLVEKNVSVKFCQNSLNGFNIRKEDLPEFIEIVEAGVLELVDRQLKGYTYIKP